MAKCSTSQIGHRAVNAILSFAVIAFMTSPLAAQNEHKAALLEYQRLIKEGVQYNARGDFKNAETAYRRAMANCQAQFGEDASTCGNALIRLALEVSNQGRFDDADPLFAMASHLAQRSTSPFDAPRYLIYRAMDLSNRGAFDRALRLVLAANKRYAVLIKAEVAAADPGDGTARQRLDPILFEFAHGLYVHAGIARQVGQMDEAARSVRLAKDVSAKVDGAPDGFLESLDNVLKARPAPRPQLGQQPEEETNFE